VRLLAAAVLLTAWLVAACAAVAEAPPTAQPCGDLHGAQRCLALTDEAAARAGRTRDDVTSLDIVHSPVARDGVLVTHSGGGFTVRLAFRDGTSAETTVCAGVDRGPACRDTQVLEARSSITVDGGYHDVPCPEPPPPAGCGTPLPTLQAASEADAKPLSVPHLVIPIDHRGTYEVSLGEASLPNGVATSASFGFVDDWPLDVSLRGGTAQIDLRSLEPDGKPFQNYYDHGWRPGVERVEALLSFEVLWYRPGAVLRIRDIGVY
jgi:hypothetical protein